MSASTSHWDTIFSTKTPEQFSWFQGTPSQSLRLVERWSSPDSSLIDVGAGVSVLVDRLLEAGWRDLTALDISSEALARLRERVGDRGVTFVTADLRTWTPQRTYDVWHDRAVFHFLVDVADRRHYVELTTRSVAPGGLAVIATFGANGPTACSGLTTCRYDVNELSGHFRDSFDLLDSELEDHVTPNNVVQSFTWVVLRRR